MIQIAGYVMELCAYHHGEVSLYATTIGLAHDFVGTNNLNLLHPGGAFGSRRGVCLNSLFLCSVWLTCNREDPMLQLLGTLPPSSQTSPEPFSDKKTSLYWTTLLMMERSSSLNGLHQSSLWCSWMGALVLELDGVPWFLATTHEKS